MIRTYSCEILLFQILTCRTDLHHLAVEDLLHIPQRTKVDIYPKHTYIACTLLTLMEVTEDGELKQVDPFKSPVGIDPDMLCQRMPLEQVDHFRYQYPVGERGPNGLKAHMEQVTMFLLPDGTFITLFQVSGASVVNPIVERLTHDYSIVRKQSDASFLLQSVMDGIVDHAIPITDAFRQEINDLETHVLALPRMKFTKELHQMTAQLSMLKRTLAPTQALVHALRGKDARSPLTDISRTYMGDVMDHCNTMVEDIDSMLALCDKLIDLVGKCPLEHYYVLEQGGSGAKRHSRLTVNLFGFVPFIDLQHYRVRHQRVDEDACARFNHFPSHHVHCSR